MKDEVWLDYVSGVVSSSGDLGIACGASQLGLRKAGFIAPVIRTFRIKGVPLTWAAPEVSAHLDNCGFVSSEVLSRSRSGRSASWTFRAILSDNFGEGLETVIDDRICRISIVTRTDSRVSTRIECVDSFSIPRPEPKRFAEPSRPPKRKAFAAACNAAPATPNVENDVDDEGGDPF